VPNKRDLEVAYSWIRYSSPKQERGDSIRRQTHLRDAWLRRNPGVRLDNSLRFKPAGVTGYTEEHRTNPKYALAQFLEKVDGNLILPGSYLLVENLDRLTREHPIHSIPFVLSLVSRGIRVVQLSPTEVVYDSDMDEGKLMLMLWDLARGHGESKRKAGLLGDVWAEKKRAARQGVPHGKTVPAWIELRDGKYRLIPERARIVRSIYLWSTAGLGHVHIVRRLQEQGVPPFGHSGRWCKGYVGLILSRRAAMGEYQPGHGRKGPDLNHEPIANYFPAAVTEAEWHAAQAAKKNRDRRTGRPAKKGVYSSPFVGLLYCALDGERMRVRDSHGAAAVISTGVDSARPDCFRGYFPLNHLVDGLLSQMRELTAADLFSDQAGAQLQEIEGRLGEVERKLTVAKEQFLSDRESTTWAGLVSQLDRERRAILEERQSAVRQSANPASATWAEAVELMKRKEPARLRQCLLATVESIWFLHVNHGQGERLGAAQVNFVGGGRRDYLIFSYQPMGWRVKRQNPRWVARSLADMVEGDFDLRDRDQAAELATALAAVDLSNF
jgi:DNA invertase Pin-like site-specific DNA recombinase